jgi:enamine deaminase RidA (YjgF/YER057c/UK114 family)
MIRKKILTDASYSIVEFDGVRRIFATVAPCRGVTLLEQAESALQTIQTLFREEAGSGSIVMQSIFLKNIEDQAACRKIIEEFYGQELPATSYIPQPPCDGKLLSIEAWGLAGSRDNVQIERLGQGMITARHHGVTWGYLADIPPEIAAGSTCDRAISAFRAVDERLNSAGWRFEDVIRTWLYLGNITGTEGSTSRYLELNRARADFYRNLKFGADLVPPEWNKTVFPASTGIGVCGNDVAIGCIALRANRSGIALFPLENPLQTSAYDYAHQYGKEKPKFVRAMAVATGKLVTTFISGTASITASESRHGNSVEQQTQQSLDNIEALIASDNFQRHGLGGVGATLDDLAAARVYVKRPAEYDVVRAICRARLGALPVIYVVADICRPELLVEVEGIAFSHRERVLS